MARTIKDDLAGLLCPHCHGPVVLTLRAGLKRLVFTAEERARAAVLRARFTPRQTESEREAEEPSQPEREAGGAQDSKARADALRAKFAPHPRIPQLRLVDGEAEGPVASELPTPPTAA